MIIRQFGLRKLFPGHRYFGKETLTNCDRNSVSSVPCVTGAALMVRHSLFSSLGGLDEELPMYFEDLDLCARIGRQQLIYHVPTAQVVHIGGKSSEGAPARSLLLAMEDGEAPWMYLRRYRGRWYARAFRAITLVSSALRLAVIGAFLPVAAIFGRPLASWAKVRIKHSRALLAWCLSSRKKFNAQVARFFGLAKPDKLESAV
jgi:GT2 family glycosyltransferase